MRIILALSLFFVIGSVQASTVSWTLTDVILEDGQTLIGGFDFDSDTNTYSTISIFNSGTTTFAATEFTQKATPTICTTSVTGCAFTRAGATSGDIVLSLSVFGNGELTNAGGTINLSTGTSDTMTFCQNGACTSWGIATADSIGVASGTITATPAVVPIPAAVWLFGSGLIGLIGAARRKKV